MDAIGTKLEAPRTNLRAGANKPASNDRVRVDGKFFAQGPQRLRLQGVTYGPFAPNADSDALPAREHVREDLQGMRDAGFNALRTYHLPPEWFLHLADEYEINVLIDVPWRKHLCFLDSVDACREARAAVERAARRGSRHSCVLAYSIGNEIPPDILRWHGPRRVQGFLRELRDVAKQADPLGLVTYASYPPTEYLDLSVLDFITFNVYLHDREAFRRYLFRLQNLAGDMPLVLGELGMDTIRHGETEQAGFLAGHLSEARLMGLAGAFVFSWTDDWHTGGHQITNWAFGITRADRGPKPSYHALREVFEAPLAETLETTPRVSVVVCTYNGGRTLEQCLRSLLDLDYPDFEIIVVDDGSTDDTRAIVGRFLPPSSYEGATSPRIRVIHQPNRGLSAARNAGLFEATGAIVAYTDSDCFADKDWLTHLVHQLVQSGAAAVGGPNLTPEDGWLAACVAASPGQPTHVLVTDQEAEHIPGCNMAFWRDALLAINGFDSLFRKAGDDVDVCWRLQQSGRWITFAPGAFVWHHRRQGPRSYLRQQAGYGEAEALLRFKHPDKFNRWGGGKWQGVLYGVSHQGLRLSKPIIYRGTFGSGMFQCLYQPGPAHWAMVPGTLEWHLTAGLVGITGFVWPPAWVIAVGMLAMSLAVAGLQAAQARLSRAHQTMAARFVIAALCYLQPLVRSWKRCRTRLFSYYVPGSSAEVRMDREARCNRLSFAGAADVAYWTEEGHDRTELLRKATTVFDELHWGKIVDAGWSAWDLEIHRHPWTTLRVQTTQEEHGGPKRLLRLSYRLHASEMTWTLGVLALLGVIAAAAWHVAAGGILAVLLLGAAALAWQRGRKLAEQARAVFATVARDMKMLDCGCPSKQQEGKATVNGEGLDG
jgi:GT2 family glycosyltransferase